MFGQDAVEHCEVFEDEGFSGGDLKRPDFQRMMKCVRERRFKAMIVYRLDRISRNISDFTGLIDELTKLGVSFISIREQFDTSTPMGRAMMFIISVFSQLERETIAERIRDNMHELAKTGRWLGGNTPTGFASESIANVTMDGKTRKTCQLKLIPEEAEIVRTIFDLYTAMDSLTAVEAELLRRRVKSKWGNDFTRFSIKGILQNPVYMMAEPEARQYLERNGVFVYADTDAFDGMHGLMVYNRTDQQKGRTNICLPMTDWIVSVGKHPGLIPARQWIAVAQSLERNKSKAYRKPRNNEALFTGLLFCACGDRMYPKLSGRTVDAERAYVYVCRRKERSKRQCCNRCNVNGNVLDRAIFEKIKLLPEDNRYFVTQLQKKHVFHAFGQELHEMQLTGLRAEQMENEKKIEGLIDSMSLLTESAARIRVVKHMEQLSETNLQIERRIRELEKVTAVNALSDAERDMLQQLLMAFSQCANELTVEEKREAVRTVVHKVIWDGSVAHVVLLGAEEELRLPEQMGLLETDPEGVAMLAKSHWREDSK